jgi:hypothetical protein
MADLRAEMSNFLKQDGKQANKPAETEQVEKEADSQNEDQSESTESESTETEPEKEQEQKDDKENKEDDKKEDPKKPNRYQRLKTQRDEAFAKLKAQEAEFGKAVKVANAWRAEAKMFERELSRVKEEAKAKGYQRSPERERLFDFERESTVRQVEEEFEKQNQEEKQQSEAVQIKEALKERFLEEGSNLVSRYKLDPQKGLKKLLVAFHAERSAGNMVSMEDVAREQSELESVRRNKNATNRQREVNGNAPRTMKPGGGVKLDYPATPEGMKGFLKSIGMA